MDYRVVITINVTEPQLEKCWIQWWNSVETSRNNLSGESAGDTPPSRLVWETATPKHIVSLILGLYQQLSVPPKMSLFLSFLANLFTSKGLLWASPMKLMYHFLIGNVRFHLSWSMCTWVTWQPANNQRSKLNSPFINIFFKQIKVLAFRCIFVHTCDICRINAFTHQLQCDPSFQL